MAVRALERSLKQEIHGWAAHKKEKPLVWHVDFIQYAVTPSKVSCTAAEFSSNIWNRCMHPSSSPFFCTEADLFISMSWELLLSTQSMFRPHHVHLIALLCCLGITADFTNVLITLCQLELFIQAKGSTRPKCMCWLIGESLEKGMSCIGTIGNIYKIPALSLRR